MGAPRGKLGAYGEVVVVAAAVILVAAQLGLFAFVTGIGPFDADATGGASTTPDPTDPGRSGESNDRAGSGSSGGTGGTGSGGGSTDAREPPPYALDVLGIEPCGNTCRDVTVRLTNERDTAARDVVVHTRIYAGNTTASDARVWEGRREVGSLAAGGSTTATERVSLSYFEALSVTRGGGWVTIVTTVESAEGTETFRERREVA
jgi:hypothetical protein